MIFEPRDSKRELPGVKRAAIDTGSLGAGARATFVAAVAGKRISVIAMVLVPSGICVARLEDTTNADLTGLLSLNQTQYWRIDPSPIAQLETAVGTGLQIENGSAGISYGGCVVYVEKD